LKIRKYRARVSLASSAIPGWARVHCASAEIATKVDAARPPSSAIATPAALARWNHSRLVIVAAKIPRGTDEPNWRNAQKRTLDASARKKATISSGDWSGDGRWVSLTISVTGTRLARNSMVNTTATTPGFGPRCFSTTGIPTIGDSLVMAHSNPAAVHGTATKKWEGSESDLPRPVDA